MVRPYTKDHFDGILLRCVDASEANKLWSEIMKDNASAYVAKKYYNKDIFGK